MRQVGTIGFVRNPVKKKCIASGDRPSCLRPGITEFLRLSNGINTAADDHVFSDANGGPLDGSNGLGYVPTSSAGQLPQGGALLVAHRVSF
jgi:hypothetical protein